MNDTPKFLVMATKKEHPGALFLDFDKMPSVWCSGCGIGIVVNTFIQSLQKSPFSLDKIQLVSSGLGCLGNVSRYIKFDVQQTQGMDPFLFAMKKSKKNSGVKTIIFIQDSDMLVYGLDGLLKACHSGENVMAVFINGFIFHFLNIQKKWQGSTNPELLFNLPALTHRSGAAVVARWTPLHCRRLISSMRTGLLNPGFVFLEIVSPCLMYYAGSGSSSKILDRMNQYMNNARINHQAGQKELELRDLNQFTIGRFFEKNDS